MSVFIYFDSVFYFFTTLCKLESVVRFIAEFKRWGDHAKKSCLAVTTKAITEEKSKFAVSVIGFFLFVLEGVDKSD